MAACEAARRVPMRNRLMWWSVAVLALVAGTARAAGAQTCVVVDEAHDMLAPAERTAAVMLIGKQFEFAGVRVVAGDCVSTY
jgi:hypothetical protein